ncbi:MAG: LysE family translocator [Thermoleophilia bacterium]|nr:LysE family translocator [Thermoleophilia bacterium]
MTLEDRYRRLLRLFPRAWRDRNGEALLDTLLEAAGPRTRPATGDVADLVRCAAAVRLRSVTGPGLAALVLVALLAVVAATSPGAAASPAFLATALVVTLVPGTGVVFTISTAVARGWRDGFTAATGCTIAIVPHVLAAVLGLSGVMQTGATAYEVVRWAGVAYLVVVGVAMIRERSGVSIDPGAAPVGGAGTIIRRAVLLNLLNPKLTVFFVAFLPQFVDGPAGAVDPRLAGLGAVFMVVTLAVFLAYAAAAAAARERLLGTPAVRTWLQRVLGGALVAFAARLAVTDR